MKTSHLLIVLLVLLAGCARKKSTETQAETQPSTEPATCTVPGMDSCQAELEAIASCFHHSVSISQKEPGETPLGAFLVRGGECSALQLEEGCESLALSRGGEVAFEKRTGSHDNLGTSEITHIVYTFSADSCPESAEIEIQLHIGTPPP
jgi:hypothetical protein